MDINQKLFIVPQNKWSTIPLPAINWAYGENAVYVISDEELDFPSKTLKDVIRDLHYNPFESTGPLADDQQLMLDINSNLEYLICLADLGLLGGGI